MIDFVKIWIDQSEAYRLQVNPNLSFKPYRDGRNELRGMKSMYRNMEIIHYNSGQVVLSGSIHVFANHGVHNYDDFNTTRLIETFYQIEQELQIRLRECRITRFEFGVNVKTSIPAKDIVKSLVSYGSKKIFSPRRIGMGIIAEADLQQYKIKIYDKGQQYSKGDNLLRFEIQSKKLKDKLGVRLAGDLLSPVVWKKLSETLLNTLKQIILIEPKLSKCNRQGKLREKDKNLLNPKFWASLIESNQSKKFHYYKTRLKVIAGTEFQEELSDLIFKKWDELTQLHRGQSKPELGRINSSYIVLNRPITLPKDGERVCPVTGFDISMQKAGSKYLSISGLKHLEKEQPKVFEELKLELLTGHENKYERTDYDRMKKQIRNRFNNAKYRSMQHYRPGQVNLLSQLAI